MIYNDKAPICRKCQNGNFIVLEFRTTPPEFTFEMGQSAPIDAHATSYNRIACTNPECDVHVWVEGNSTSLHKLFFLPG